MIRINLLPAKDVRRKRRTAAAPAAGAAGGNIAVVFLVVLAVEVGGLYYWYMQADEATQAVGAGQNEANQKLQTLKQAQSTAAELQKTEAEVQKQRAIFDVLENGKVGPANLLLFLSYALRKVDLSTMAQDEYSLLGELWAPSADLRKKSDVVTAEDAWDPETVWITSIKENDGSMTMEGEAKEHEDVMSFLRRLRTSVYFEAVDLVNQKVVTSGSLQERFVQFKLKCEVNYDPRGYPPI